jgi:hypothetical protein
MREKIRGSEVGEKGRCGIKGRKNGERKVG